MKKLIASLTILLAASLTSANDDAHMMMKAPTMPKDFAKIKSFVGNWTATSKMGDKTDTADVSIELTAGGTAIMERMFTGSPHEMISMYHADGDKVAMTHYCLLGNQPEMKLKEATDNKLVFDMDGNKGIKSAKEFHMHTLTITMQDANHITEEWVSFKDGKKADTKVITLARK